MNKAPMGRADLHLHTNASDGVASVVEVLNFVAKYRPLNALAITDHDTLDASLWAYERRNLYPFDIIPGVEVSCYDGHMLGLWVTEPIKRGMSLTDTAAAIHEQGGLAILAHPFHMLIGSHRKAALRHFKRPKGLLELGIDGLEIHNGGIARTGFNLIAARTARKMGIAVTAGSDAHTLGAIGTGQTLFAGNSADDLRRALTSKTTLTKGYAWSITDYVGYLKHERQRKAQKSLETISFSPHNSKPNSLR